MAYRLVSSHSLASFHRVVTQASALTRLIGPAHVEPKPALFTLGNPKVFFKPPFFCLNPGGI